VQGLGAAHGNVEQAAQKAARIGVEIGQPAGLGRRGFGHGAHCAWPRANQWKPEPAV